MERTNCYEDDKRAEAYAKLAFPGTYYLAFRDLPDIIRRHAKGNKALDFGCGTGRSSRFLRGLGFNTVGVDISREMIVKAREIDPEGDYRLIENARPDHCGLGSFDLVLAAFTFDNISGEENKINNLKALKRLLNKQGRIINLVSSPAIYTHEWVSFSTRDFPENHDACSGGQVKIIITDIDDKRAVDDCLWTSQDYERDYRQAGFKVIEAYHPLGREGEGFEWVNENRVPPWDIYVLG